MTYQINKYECNLSKLFMIALVGMFLKERKKEIICLIPTYIFLEPLFNALNNISFQNLIVFPLPYTDL